MPRLQLYQQLLTRHVQNQYLVISLSHNIVTRALSLHEIHWLRALDSIQLATALELNTRLTSSGTNLTFVASDVRLIAAASTEGLLTDNPNNHP